MAHLNKMSCLMCSSARGDKRLMIIRFLGKYGARRIIDISAERNSMGGQDRQKRQNLIENLLHYNPHTSSIQLLRSIKTSILTFRLSSVVSLEIRHILRLHSLGLLLNR
mmetsp:Transcript_2364/g.5113  ORF Transcript_2364/g.5113 Transcript_2364/m.5113 type:complete len:109 (-) Transcript_2364:182-508(-)